MITFRKTAGVAAALALALSMSACSSSSETATETPAASAPAASAPASPSPTATSSVGAASEAFCTSSAALEDRARQPQDAGQGRFGHRRGAADGEGRPEDGRRAGQDRRPGARHRREGRGHRRPGRVPDGHRRDPCRPDRSEGGGGLHRRCRRSSPRRSTRSTTRSAAPDPRATPMWARPLRRRAHIHVESGRDRRPHPGVVMRATEHALAYLLPPSAHLEVRRARRAAPGWLGRRSWAARAAVEREAPAGVVPAAPGVGASMRIPPSSSLSRSPIPAAILRVLRQAASSCWASVRAW